MMRVIKVSLFSAGFLAALAGTVIGIFNIKKTESLERQLSLIQDSIATLSQDQASTSQKIAIAEQKITANSLRQVTPGKTQDQLLTAAVAKVAPAVVSVVISKDIPNLQVTYVNPFGNDPAFQNFGFQIPVYQQRGSTLQAVGAGSGFLISHDGYILTNRHVVEDPSAQYTVLLSNGIQKSAQVVYRALDNDVAVLKIGGTYSTIANLGDSSSMKLGQTVIAIGNALGEYSNSVSTGIISGLNRTIQATGNGGQIEQLTGVIQTDASINPGNSGGPLIDLAGNVVGVNVATVMGSSNISFSIPINLVRSTIQSYI